MRTMWGLELVAAITAAMVASSCSSGGTAARTQAPSRAPRPSAPVSVTTQAVANGARGCVRANEVQPFYLQLVGDTLAFCIGAQIRTEEPSCFTADLARHSVAGVATPPGALTDARAPYANGVDMAAGASIDAKPKSDKGITVCTANKVTCHDLSIPNKSPMAASDDATLVARVTQRDGANYPPDRAEIWDAVTGKRRATFDLHCPEPQVPEAGEGGCMFGFLGHSLFAFKEPCAQPCSHARLYDTRGQYLGMLAAEASTAHIDHFHDSLYVLDNYQGGFVVQDSDTTKVVLEAMQQASSERVTPDRIARVVGGAAPRVEVWGRDLKLAFQIAVPLCPLP